MSGNHMTSVMQLMNDRLSTDMCNCCRFIIALQGDMKKYRAGKLLTVRFNVSRDTDSNGVLIV